MNFLFNDIFLENSKEKEMLGNSIRYEVTT